MSRHSIKVKHNVEMAHRLFLTPGKCEAIHGHSWNVTLELFGEVNDKGILLGLNFGYVKSEFRSYLDRVYDHHLLLNGDDTWANYKLPGLSTITGDPTTENLASLIGRWSTTIFAAEFTRVEVWETAVNCATWESSDA